MKTRTAALTVAACVIAAAAFAQGNPRGAASATVGGKNVSVDYGRPALKGRNLDDLLKQLPADRIWRAGENQVTTLTAEGEITVGGKKVPAGKYSLYVRAGENNAWDFILNKDQGVPLGQIYAQASEKMKNEPWPRMDYSKSIAASEVVRVPMAAAKTAAAADQFTIGFAPKGKGQELTMAWGTQAWSVEIQPAK